MKEKIEIAIAAMIKVMKLNILGKVNKIIIPIIPVKTSTKLVTVNKVLILLFPIKVKIINCPLFLLLTKYQAVINTNNIKISIKTFNTTYVNPHLIKKAACAASLNFNGI